MEAGRAGMQNSQTPGDDSAIGFFLPPDFPYRDLLQVSEKLTGADVCVPGFGAPPVGLYHPHGYLYEHGVEGRKTVLLPDRNVASRMAQLGQGNVVKTDQQLRTAAALLAFAQCLDIEIEPSTAFHELAHKEGNQVAWAELGWFRAADNARTQELINVALGRSDSLVSQYAPHEVPAHDLAKPVKRWRRNYVIALKMMEFEREKLQPVERVLRLFDWMCDDFMFGGPAALLASVYFAPNSPPIGGVFKDKNSVDPEVVLAGVRNAAWDMTYLSEFVRQVNANDHDVRTRYLFASFDKRLRRFAKLLFEYGADEESQPTALPVALSQWWPRRDAERITQGLWAQIERVTAPDWKARRAPRPDYVDYLIEQGENHLRKSALC